MEKDKNPYFAMPRMVMLTYKLPSNIEEIAKEENSMNLILMNFLVPKENMKVQNLNT